MIPKKDKGTNTKPSMLKKTFPHIHNNLHPESIMQQPTVIHQQKNLYNVNAIHVLFSSKEIKQ